MAIPEDVLDSWTAVGSTQKSSETYSSIKMALERHDWLSCMDHKVYLQGSYANFTNIRGDSDVDVVVEATNVFYDNLSDEVRNLMGFTKGRYGWQDFKDQVYKALLNHYGTGTVTEGSKCFKVAGKGSRLNADVLPCVTFRHYESGSHSASGITFWTKSGTQVVNYPEHHKNNGQAKNQRCLNQYKPTVRIFKNAGNKANNDFPSYFLECLLYNAPDHFFSSSRSDTFANALNYLIQAKNDGSLQGFKCQNGIQHIFGTEPHQIDIASADQFVSDLIKLWNNWE